MQTLPLLLAAALAAVGPALAGKLPDNIKRCARAGPGLDECLRGAVEDALPKLKHGLPKLGLATLDPLYVQELRIQQGGGGPVSADLVLRDMVTTGLLDNVKVHSIHVDLTNDTIDASFRFQRAVVTSNYTVNGRFLVLPLTGSGTSRIVLHGSDCSWQMKGKRITKIDGNEYMDIPHVDIKMVPTRMEMQLDNLFNGDQRLGKAMNRAINENWQLLYNEIGPVFEEAYGEVVRRHARSVFLHVPIDELFPETL